MVALQHAPLSENRQQEAESKVEERLLDCRGLELEEADNKSQAANNAQNRMKMLEGRCRVCKI